MSSTETTAEPAPAPYVAETPLQSPRAERRAPSAARWSKSLPLAAEPFLVAALVTLALLLIRLPAELRLPGSFNDDGVYLSLGRALAEGDGYRNTYLVDAPPQVKFPPGLPLIHALLWMVFGSLERVAAAASLIGTVAAGAGAAVVWWFGRTRLGLGRFVIAVGAIAPMLIASAVDYWTLPITESWFLLGWASLLLLLERPAEDDAPALGRAALAGALIAATVLFRTQAITLLPAALAALALRRRWREAAAVLVVAVPPIAAWQLWAARATAAVNLAAAPDDAGYTKWIPDGRPLEVVKTLAQVVAWNVERYVGSMASHLGRPRWQGMIVFAAFVALAVVGAWRLRRARPALWLSIAAALALLLLWPSPQDRLLFPVLPFAGLLAAAAATWLLQRASIEARLGALAVSILAVGVVGIRQGELRATSEVGITGEGAPWFRTSSWFLPHNSVVIATAAKWARIEGREDDRVLTSLPSGFWLLTGRGTKSGEPNESVVAKSVWSVPGEFLRARLREDGITAVVVDGPDRALARDLRLLWERCPNGFTNVGVGPWGGFPAVFRVHRDDACLRTLLAEPRRS